MKIGFCAKIDLIDQVAAAGFDYIEPPVNAAAAWTEEAFEAYVRRMENAPIPALSFNLLFPKDLLLLDDKTSNAEIAAYLHRAFARMRKLGGSVAVFGSGKSRMRPEGMSYCDAFRRLTEVTRLTGEIAAQYGVTIVIEPLNRGETNMINSVAEGACLEAAVNHPAVKLLADYYHIAVEHQPPEELNRLDGIAHAHIATEEGRRVPVRAEEGFSKMFAAMKKTGYAGLISVEGKADDLQKEGPVSVQLLKTLWEEA